MKNFIALVLDSSGSMSSLSNKVIDMTNRLIDEFKTNATKFNQETYLTLITFGNRSKVHYTNIPIDRVNKITNEYRINGMTALFSAVTDAVQSIDNASKEDSFIVYTLTDGEENASLFNHVSNIGRLLKEKQQTDQWSFIFQLPKGHEAQFCNRYGIPTDNVRGWDITEAGLLLAQQQASAGFNTYYQARAVGKKSVSNFFADLSKVDPKELGKLKDVSRQYKVYQVEKEAVVKDFVEEKTKKPYVLGCAYYQLYKKELVQGNKDLLVMEKGKKKIIGGEQARQLIGLPKEDVKLDPYDLSKYEVFPQSSSVNRKLARGTKVIVKL